MTSLPSLIRALVWFMPQKCNIHVDVKDIEKCTRIIRCLELVHIRLRLPLPQSPYLPSRMNVRFPRLNSRVMDSSNDWTVSALFSPSKARVQQAQAKDWASVDAWLARKYGQQLGPFERNEETLHVLLKLATLNDSADEQRGLTERVEKSALQAIAKRVANEDGTYSAALKHLSTEGQYSLETLANAAVLLQSTDLVAMSERLCELTSSHFDSYEEFRKHETQEEALKREHARLMDVLKDLKSDTFQTSESLLEQTSEFTSNAKHLRAKIGEYDERLSSARAQTSNAPKLEQVAQRMSDLQQQRDRLSHLQSTLSAFKTLPPDAKDARSKVESARTELLQLTTKRDNLFEGLIDD